MGIQALIFMFIIFGHVEADWKKMPKWDFCDCEWYPWMEWSRCSQTCGGGRQSRERWVYYKTHEACSEFSDCADKGSEFKNCGQSCQNNGTFVPYTSFGGFCSCLKGYAGECCEKAIFCPTPSQIDNGRIDGSHYGYKSSIKYVCNDGYSLGNYSSERTMTRRCTLDAKWTNDQPRCQYIRSCSSSPCRNKAKCIDVPGSYRCECGTGWTGQNCETDIQVPVIQGCPDNTAVISDKTIAYFLWKEPLIYDPHGSKVNFTVKKFSETFSSKWIENLTTPVANLPMGERRIDFPWGEHRIEYLAFKPNNEMTATCNFTITVKPVPCKGLPVAHHVLLCNSWLTTYKRVCKPLCLAELRPVNDVAFKGAWYECLEDGNWHVPTFYETCIPALIKSPFPKLGKPVPVLKKGCSDERNIFDARLYYVKELQMSPLYSDLCQHKDCKPNNVEVHC